MSDRQTGGLTENLHRLHTTPLGAARIGRNLELCGADAVSWCRDKISSAEAVVSRAGKNWYISAEGYVITVNAYSFTIITAHRSKNAGGAARMSDTKKSILEDTSMTEKDYIIRPETPEDYAEVENLVREAFWNVYRPGCSEHYLIHALRGRADFVKELDFVMEKDGRLIGQVVYTRAFIQADDGRAVPIMTMGPIGILPEFKRQGYGKALLDYSMEKAAALGAGALCFEGNIDFYGKSGFVVASTMGVHYHGEPRESEVPYFLCRELTPGYLSGVEGVFHQPLADIVDEAALEEFDKQFPYKEKLKLPGQLA